MRFNKCPLCGEKMEITDFSTSVYPSRFIVTKEFEIYAKCFHCGAELMLRTNNEENVYSKIDKEVLRGDYDGK